MSFLGFLEGFATNLLAALFDKQQAAFLLAAIVIGVGVFFLKKKNPSLASQVLYGIAAFCAVLVILCAFTFMATLSKEKLQVTPINVETHIKTWLESYGYGIRKITFPDTHFAYEIKPNDNSGFILMRHQSQRGDYLNLQAVVETPPQHKAVLARVKGEQLARLTHEFYLEIAKARVNGWLDPTDKLERVWMTRRFPINNLTEESFMQQVREISSAINIVQAAMIVAVDQAMTYTPPVSPPKQ